MKNSKQLFQDFVQQLTLKENREEVQGIAYLVFESVFHLNRAAILSEKNMAVSTPDQHRLADIAQRINAHEPVQYILGAATFAGRKFKVSPAVLIPRPETEEIVYAVTARLASLYNNFAPGQALKILDVGTGSGCIAISLALAIASAALYATDVSRAALSIASENARQLKAQVSFLEHDILAAVIPVAQLDAIVSNPPYIALQEKPTMAANVVDHEPHLALFVDDADPLLFYRNLVTKGSAALKKGGMLFVEINERYGNDVAGLFKASGYSDVEITKDISGKDRMVTGRK